MPELLGNADGGGPVPCAVCGAEAAGPCATCRKPLCGDCCVIETGSAGSPWAVCHACHRKGRSALDKKWRLVLGWVAQPILGLLVAMALFYWLFGG